MDYILRGNDKDVSNVLKEQRIRIGRGVISFTPISEFGLITEENARRTLEDKIAEKNELIASLTGECDTLKVRVAELEAVLIKDDTMSETDNKNVVADDNKDLSIAESKNLLDDDSMFIDIEADNKKTKKK